MLDCGKSQHQLVEGMDEVEMRLFSWGTEENKKKYTCIYQKTNKKILPQLPMLEIPVQIF